MGSHMQKKVYDVFLTNGAANAFSFNGQITLIHMCVCYICFYTDFCELKDNMNIVSFCLPASTISKTNEIICIKCLCEGRNSRACC